MLEVRIFVYNFLQLRDVFLGSFAQGIILKRAVMTAFSQPAFALVAIAGQCMTTPTVFFSNVYSKFVAANATYRIKVV